MSETKQNIRYEELVRLLQSAVLKKDFTEVKAYIENKEFESPFLEISRIEPEEKALAEAKYLVSLISKIQKINNKEAQNLVQILMKSSSPLAGNILHQLIAEARFKTANQSCVVSAILENDDLSKTLLSEQDYQNATPLDFMVTLVDGDFGELEKIALVALDKNIHVPELFTIAMQQKNHDLVAKIYTHDNTLISSEDQILFQSYRNKFKEVFKPFENDEIFKFLTTEPEELESLKLVSEALIEGGEKLNSLTKFGTPLTIAVKNGSNKLAELLISKGADPNLPDTEAFITPLMYSVMNADKDMIRKLLAKGADSSISDLMGLTPRMAAESLGHKEIASFLKVFEVISEQQKLEHKMKEDGLFSSSALSYLGNKLSKAKHFYFDSLSKESEKEVLSLLEKSMSFKESKTQISR